jgi:MOSC domain
MSPLLDKLPFRGRVESLLAAQNRGVGLEKSARAELRLLFSGIDGDCHGGLTRLSDSRTLRQYPRNTDIKNTRQATLLSVEELADVAAAMGIPEIKPEWVGANIVTSGIPDLTLLPPCARLQFPSGATLTIDMENAPCRQVADVIARHYPDQKKGFVAAARHKRGLTAWVEREGVIGTGDDIVIWIPPQRTYPRR